MINIKLQYEIMDGYDVRSMIGYYFEFVSYLIFGGKLNGYIKRTHDKDVMMFPDIVDIKKRNCLREVKACYKHYQHKIPYRQIADYVYLSVNHFSSNPDVYFDLYRHEEIHCCKNYAGKYRKDFIASISKNEVTHLSIPLSLLLILMQKSEYIKEYAG